MRPVVGRASKDASIWRRRETSGTGTTRRAVRPRSLGAVTCAPSFGPADRGPAPFTRATRATRATSGERGPVVAVPAHTGKLDTVPLVSSLGLLVDTGVPAFRRSGASRRRPSPTTSSSTTRPRCRRRRPQDTTARHRARALRRSGRSDRGPSADRPIRGGRRASITPDGGGGLALTGTDGSGVLRWLPHQARKQQCKAIRAPQRLATLHDREGLAVRCKEAAA
jgi:hypothetical protein